MFTALLMQYFSLMNDKLKIIPSLQGGVFTKRVDPSKLTFGSQINPQQGFISQWAPENFSNQKTNFNLSSGLLLEYYHLYLGVCAYNVNQPDEGLYGSNKLPLRWNFHASYNLIISEKTLIHFFIRYQKQQRFYYYQANVSCILFRHLILGTGYKYSDSPYALVGYKHDFFTLQLDYEKYYSYLSGGDLSAYEISAFF
ncbi:MAG: hypothetical protein JWO32_422 [Bacteroidetes bacterium]|nr:hypothetical protein [Bacteroidota bacterium]